MTRRCRGFTLIELLVVLTILGLLAAGLFPIFARVREGACRAACLSNEHQLGMAIIQYTADNDSSFPNDRTPGTEGLWAAQVDPMVKDARVYRCPDDTTESTLDRHTPPTHYSVDSYGMNLNLLENVRYNVTQGVVEEVTPSASQSVLTAPARTVLLFEVAGDAAALTPPGNGHLGCAASGNGNRDPAAPGFPFAAGCRHEGNHVVFETRYATGLIGGRSMTTNAAGYFVSGIETVEPRHARGANYVACDGHAVWLRPEAVSGGQSQPVGGAGCGQDDASSSCGGTNMAAGTANGQYALTFSVQ